MIVEIETEAQKKELEILMRGRLKRGKREGKRRRTGIELEKGGGME